MRTLLSLLFFVGSMAHSHPRDCASHLFVVGLGNVGYDGTRHNAGFTLIDEMIAITGAVSFGDQERWLFKDFATEELAQDYARHSGASNPRVTGKRVDYRVGGEVFVVPETAKHSTLVFVKPYYDINESGEFLAELRDSLGLKLEQLVILVDDISLDRNQVVLTDGLAAGDGDRHNGLRSINEHLQTGAYLRLRFGVSNPKRENEDETLEKWVTGPLPEQDLTLLRKPERVAAVLGLLQNLQARLVAPAGNNYQTLSGNISRLTKWINKNK